ncbi:MAG: transcriptional regulator, LysR family [Gammaproteobacteria bacterium]|nr:transcriptional regulator, LysR family [Gammaproteobacteria bacterium]
MNLRHLSVFHGIAKAGSVNAAARLLHTSQPAVSRELRTLEDRLGVPLFDRLPRGMRLTEAGRMLLGYAERIFGLEQAAERAMRELADLEGGELAIGASNTLGTYLLPPFVAAFHIRYPKVSLNLDIRNTQEVVRGVLDLHFALGFVEGRVRDESLEVKEFRRDRILAVVAPGHCLAKASAPSVQSLAATASILREPGSGTREIVERAFARHRLQPRRGLQISSSEAVKRAALEGGGVGWISEVCVAEELRTGRLVALRTPRLSLERPLYSLRLRGRHISRSALMFLQGFDPAVG